MSQFVGKTGYSAPYKRSCPSIFHQPHHFHRSLSAHLFHEIELLGVLRNVFPKVAKLEEIKVDIHNYQLIPPLNGK